MENTKHFHDSAVEWSAKVVDWVDLNREAKLTGQLTYIGNYFDDDCDGTVYAVFKRYPLAFCVVINK